MANGANKPSIYVWTTENHADQVLKAILNGIEEEGIPYEVKNIAGGHPVQKAYEAACQSILSVGIAIIGDTAVLHYKNLNEDHPLFQYSPVYAQPNVKLRNLGANAARLVKGIPFKSLKS